MNWSSSFMMASKISLPKFKLNCGISGPDGTKSCNKSKIQSKSSGNPIGNASPKPRPTDGPPPAPAGGVGKDTDPQDEEAPRERPAFGGLGKPIPPPIPNPNPIENGGKQGIAELHGIVLVYISSGFFI